MDKLKKIECNQEYLQEIQTSIQTEQQQFIHQQQNTNTDLKEEIKTVRSHTDLLNNRCQQQEAKMEIIQKEQTNITEKLGKMSLGNNKPSVIIPYPYNIIPTENSLPKFNGKNIQPTEFITRFRKYWDRRKNLTQDSSINYFLELIEASLEGNPSKWFQMIMSTISNEEDFYHAFHKKYWNETIQDGLKTRLRDERYNPNGRLNRTEYFTEKVLLFKSLKPIPPETEIVKTLINHFDQDIKRSCNIYRITNINDLEEYLNYLDNNERNERPKNSHWNSPSPPHNFHDRNSSNHQRNSNFRNRTNHNTYTNSREPPTTHHNTNGEPQQQTNHQSEPTHTSRYYSTRNHPYEQPRNSNYTNSRTFENRQHKHIDRNTKSHVNNISTRPSAEQQTKEQRRICELIDSTNPSQEANNTPDSADMSEN